MDVRPQGQQTSRHLDDSDAQGNLELDAGCSVAATTAPRLDPEFTGIHVHVHVHCTTAVQRGHIARVDYLE